ncbi:SWIM zinc finger family protein [Streptomyces sp. MI02-7b]|uniref:SWIM zinc finger family protein n=1 Tax=Streptomyces sp. MI02-7b TaxID=462941 RepID=UPI0029A57EBE|nr:SWIM zinc finger family protein [Streptomyces sp. MI02-7b]MDX3071890.1 SWIM zinc finger domain-containing protein [Streptomyces sp. MI02-7b]
MDGMDEQRPERWTADQVLALAPDASSRKAGTGLAAAARWSGTGTSGTAVWGLCAGSGSKPYQTVVDTAGPGAKCSCPSRKFPCKHAIGLLLLWSGGEVGPAAHGGGRPDWVTAWLEARRAREDRKSAPAGGGDPAAARKRAEQRERRVAAGAAELEQRLTDLLLGGLTGADREGYGRWEETAARMVDAQAPGLASRVRELGAVAASGGDWPSRLLEETALLHLLNRGCLGHERLPGALAATVRSRVGFTVDSAELLSGPTVRDHWLVLAQHDAADDRLTTRRIWLHGRDTGRPALLLSFGAAGRAPELALPVGLGVDAELAYHPGARPLRAVLGTRHAAPGPGSVPPGLPVGAALAVYGQALADDPWLDAWPTVLAGVVPVPGDTGWQLADGEGADAVPVAAGGGSGAGGLWRLAAVSGGRPVTVFGELGHRGFRPYTVWGEGGTAAVALAP